MVNQVKSLETNKPWVIKVGDRSFVIKKLLDVEKVLEYREKLIDDLNDSSVSLRKCIEHFARIK
jgi:hypothetical protein